MILNNNPFRLLSLMTSMGREQTELTLNHTNVQKLLASNGKFDAVIVTEFMFDALKAFSNKFDAHLIIFSNHGALNWYYSSIGHYVPPSAFPEVLLSFPAKMTFFQRAANTIVYIFFRLLHEYILLPNQQKLVEKYFPGFPSLRDITQNVSLAIVNSHNSLNFAHSKSPLMIDVAGFHIKPPKKLPSDLQTLLDSAKEGAIYFSMGSHLKPDDLPADSINMILKAFSKRKEKILWKWNQDTLPGKPENVYLGKWFPQQDILG